MQLNFRSLVEARPGAAWRKVYAHGWPGWGEWFLARTRHNRPGISEARKALRRHMPEFEGLWDELISSCNASEDAARFLSFWSPPRYLVNCSQAALVDDDGPLLVRNYDLDPDLNEATVFSTKWRGRRVMGMVEGMSGLADGMNDAGLAASLTFGGRVVVQSGFGIPIIMRYVLEMCSDVPDAVEALRAVPSHMSYNVTVVDRNGDWTTVFIAPDRPAIVTRQPWATNHQLGVEWPRHGRVSNTLGRAAYLKQMLARKGLTSDELAAAFQKKPLFSTNYIEGFGTVYTSMYRPALGRMALGWNDGSAEYWDIDQGEERFHSICYSDSGSHTVPLPASTPDEPAPAWYSSFLSSLSSAQKDQDGSEQARLAAFWRRNHLGRDRGWSNLNSFSKTHAAPKEE